MKKRKKWVKKRRPELYEQQTDLCLTTKTTKILPTASRTYHQGPGDTNHIVRDLLTCPQVVKDISQETSGCRTHQQDCRRQKRSDQGEERGSHRFGSPAVSGWAREGRPRELGECTSRSSSPPTSESATPCLSAGTLSGGTRRRCRMRATTRVWGS